MLFRSAVAAALLVSLLGACDNGDTLPSPAESSSTTIAGEVLSYAFVPGETISYEVSISQHLVLSAEGETGDFAGDDVPAGADVNVTASGPFTFAVGEGDEPASVSIKVTGEFDETLVDGTVDGEPVDDLARLSELGVAQPVAASLVVDSRGRVLDQSAGGLGASPLAGLTGDLGRFPGPVLSGDAVGEGSVWSATTSGTTFGGEPVETVTEARLTGSEDLDGVPTMLIEATTRTGAADIDLSEFFAQFMGTFADDPDAAPAAGDIVFRINIDPSESQSTTWFDPAVGLARRVMVTGEPTNFAMEVALPDEATGELQRYTMDLSVSQALDYRLMPPT